MEIILFVEKVKVNKVQSKHFVWNKVSLLIDLLSWKELLVLHQQKIVLKVLKLSKEIPKLKVTVFIVLEEKY
jgi:hypothetical protein